MANIVLAHGWGFDHHVWDAVRERLAPSHRVECIDFGFFGAVPPSATARRAFLARPPCSAVASSAPTFSQPVIAVGHSLGACWWLTQSTMPWRRLLSINGFPRFTEAADYLPAVAPRVLARMRKQFAQTPAAVLAEFLSFCGATPDPAEFNAARLAAGLDWLADWDGRERLIERTADIFALASRNDPIVPAGMSKAAFAALGDRLAFADVAGHVLPLAAPDFCAEWIERIAAQ